MSEMNRERRLRENHILSRRSFVAASAGAGLVALGGRRLSAQGAPTNCDRTTTAIFGKYIEQIFGAHGSADTFASILFNAESKFPDVQQKLALTRLRLVIHESDTEHGSGTYKRDPICFRDLFVTGIDNLEKISATRRQQIKDKMDTVATFFCLPGRNLPTENPYFVSCGRLLDGWKVGGHDVPGMMELFQRQRLIEIFQSRLDFGPQEAMRSLWKVHIMRAARDLGLIQDGHVYEDYKRQAVMPVVGGQRECAYFNGTGFACQAGGTQDKCVIQSDGTVAPGTTFCNP